MDFQRELELLLRSRFTLICIVSREEERILANIQDVCERGKRAFLSWDLAEGFHVHTEKAPRPQKAADPLTVLEAVDKLQGTIVIALKDFHRCWDRQPKVVRKLRNLAQRLKYSKKTIIITLPSAKIPDELKDDAVILDFPAPELPEIEAILEQLLKTPGVRCTLDANGRARLLRSALGLSSTQAQRVLAKAIVSNGVLDERDIELVTREKSAIIRESGALEYYPASESMASVGGLGRLKEWLNLREQAFGQEARDYGLPAPKGLALIGIPGTGKSLSAKMIASLWQLPLIRMDVGALFGGLVGQSEENVRRALTLAETISPCVLWIDEMEKALATGSGAGDSGTSMRVFGSLLSWMQDKEKPVFVVATANDVGKLPPELLRRGRFDEIFFLDLPTAEERKEIFAVHIRKRKRKIGAYDLDRLAGASEGYVGAEIEQAVIDAMYVAFNDTSQPKRDFTTEDILAAIGRQVPMSQSQRENINYLRQWLQDGRAASASYSEHDTAAPERTMAIQLSDDALENNVPHNTTVAVRGRQQASGGIQPRMMNFEF